MPMLSIARPLMAVCLFLPGLALAEINWEQSKQNSREVMRESFEGIGRAWDKTVDNSVWLWKDTQNGSKQVWEHTKEQSSDLADDLNDWFEQQSH